MNGGVIDDDGETFAQLEHNTVMTSAMPKKNKDEFQTSHMMGKIGASLRSQSNQSHMQEFTPQFPANTQALTNSNVAG